MCLFFDFLASFVMVQGFTHLKNLWLCFEKWRYSLSNKGNIASWEQLGKDPKAQYPYFFAYALMGIGYGGNIQYFRNFAKVKFDLDEPYRAGFIV